MSKKFITLLLVLIVFGVILFLIYFLFFTEYAIDPARPERETNELYNPFGDSFPVDDFEGDTDFDTEFTTDMVSKLKQITTVPVSGFEIFYTEDIEEVDLEAINNSNNENSVEVAENSGVVENNLIDETYFRYIERATGHVYETSYNAESNTRISNVTIPKSHESLFINSGNQIIYRYIDEDNPETIKTYVSNFNYNSSSGIIAEIFSLNDSDGYFLMDNITHIIKSISDNLFALISRKGSGGFNSVGFTIDKEDISKIDVILESEISEFIPQWINDDYVALTTMASHTSDGYLYKLNLDTGVLERVIGPFKGLTTNFSPNGKYVILSISTGTGYETYVYNIETSAVNKTFVNTVADKCVWTADSVEFFCGGQISLPDEMPDLWYKGIFKFSDILISHDMNDFEFKVYNEYNRNLIPQLDFTNMKISEKGDYIIMQDKTDLTLWAYDLR